MNRFITADASLCIGCRTCEVACVAAHAEDSVDVFTPASFHPRLKVVKDGDETVPMTCHQCDGAPCAQICMYGAMVLQGKSVQVQHDRCVGCGACAMVCPFSAIEMAIVNGAAQALKCDLCVTRLEGPACVAYCPTKALRFVTPDDLKELCKVRRLKARDLDVWVAMAKMV